MTSRTYKLYRGGTLLGTIVHDNTASDFPWFGGIFSPSPEFEAVRPLFERELRLLDADDYGEWDSAWLDIQRPGLRLEADDGETVSELLIHIDGAKTWWRC